MLGLGAKLTQKVACHLLLLVLMHGLSIKLLLVDSWISRVVLRLLAEEHVYHLILLLQKRIDLI